VIGVYEFATKTKKLGWICTLFTDKSHLSDEKDRRSR